MISSRTACVTLLAALLTAGGTAWAGALRPYAIDAEHSAVLFKVMNRDIAFIYGRFKSVTGTISADGRTKQTQIALKVEVNAHSVDTNSKKRDRELKSKKFFTTSKFKKITFESKTCKKLEGNDFELTGDLTCMGKTVPLTVVFEVTGSKGLGKGLYRIGGQATFTIKRSDFGLDAWLPEVADEVTVIVSLEGERYSAPAG